LVRSTPAEASCRTSSGSVTSAAAPASATCGTAACNASAAAASPVAAAAAEDASSDEDAAEPTPAPTPEPTAAPKDDALSRYLRALDKQLASEKAAITAAEVDEIKKAEEANKKHKRGIDEASLPLKTSFYLPPTLSLLLTSDQSLLDRVHVHLPGIGSNICLQPPQPGLARNL
jgi:hypothetical protein